MPRRPTTPVGSWSALIPALLQLFSVGTPAQRKYAENEIRRMAQVADGRQFDDAGVERLIAAAREGR